MFSEGNKYLNYFRKPPDPKELVRKWQSDVRSEQRRLEKEETKRNKGGRA